mgnify:CR=1 FL=1
MLFLQRKQYGGEEEDILPTMTGWESNIPPSIHFERSAFRGFIFVVKHFGLRKQLEKGCQTGCGRHYCALNGRLDFGLSAGLCIFGDSMYWFYGDLAKLSKC